MTVNGMPVVYNNAVVFFDGAEAEINGYIQSIDYDTNAASDHVQTLTPDGVPIAVNPINVAPFATIRFAPGAFALFWQLMNTRFAPFTLTIESYTTGNLAGSTHTVSLVNCLFAGKSAQITPQTAASTNVLQLKCTNILD